MQDPKEMEFDALPLLQLAEELLARHEQQDHEGKPCWHNRASVLAWLAHCLGFRGKNLSPGVDLIQKYMIDQDGRCEGHGGHRVN